MKRKPGRDLRRISYYRALSYWRLASITQGVYRRYMGGAMGNADGPDMASYKNQVLLLAIAALEQLNLDK